MVGLSYVYELPFGRGKTIGSNWHPAVNAILGGWKTNGIWRFSTGQPLSHLLQSEASRFRRMEPSARISAPIW